MDKKISNSFFLYIFFHIALNISSTKCLWKYLWCYLKIIIQRHKKLGYKQII